MEKALRLCSVKLSVFAFLPSLHSVTILGCTMVLKSNIEIRARIYVVIVPLRMKALAHSVILHKSKNAFINTSLFLLLTAFFPYLKTLSYSRHHLIQDTILFVFIKPRHIDPEAYCLDFVFK